jgi:hypothetical protein
MHCAAAGFCATAIAIGQQIRYAFDFCTAKSDDDRLVIRYQKCLCTATIEKLKGFETPGFRLLSNFLWLVVGQMG